jgi:iron complex transport system substrate-binding protein
MGVMRLKGMLLYLLLIGAVLGLLWPRSQPLTGTESAELHDFVGREITMPAAKPMRIVSLSPGNTEILFALGAGDRVVGVTDYCDYPAIAKERPKVGGFQSPDLETIVQMQPDIVFASGAFQSQIILALERAGITVVAIEPHSVPDVLRAIELVGLLIGEQDNASQLNRQLGQILDRVRAAAQQGDKPRVFVEVWDLPFMTVGGKSYISDVVAQAGGINVAAGRTGDYIPGDFETLYTYNPDVYLVAHRGGLADGETMVTSKPELQDIAAIKNGQVYTITDDFLARPGPRSFVAMEQVAAILQAKSKGIGDSK